MGYREAFGRDDESLALFMRCMAEFDRMFTDAMIGGVDFTLRLEVRGDRGKLLHARVQGDRFERPAGSGREATRPK